MPAAAKADARPTVRILGTHGVPANYGGFETAAENVALFLRDNGWRVIVYCQEQGDGQIREDVWNGIERVIIPESREGWLGTSRFDLRSIRHATRSRDICLTFGYNTAVFNVLQRLRRIPNVINMDGIEWSRARWGKARQAILWTNERIACFVGNDLIADHPEIHKYLQTRARDSKITTITYGAHRVDEAPTEPVTSRGLEPGRYLTLICRPIPENSILELVQGFSARPRGFRLAVFGRYEPDQDPYHRQVVDAASDEVDFVGPIYDPGEVAALRLHCAAYLHGHTVGGTNPSLVEAMAAGNPVLAHDNDYNRWVADDAARFFRTASDVDRMLTLMLEDDELRQRMGAAARARHAQEFTWEHVAGQYRDLLAKHLPPGAAPQIRPQTQARRREDHDMTQSPIRIGIVGLGKMGLSHVSMIRAHPDVSVEAVVDQAGYVLDVLSKYTGLRTFTDYDEMLKSVELDAVIIATPTRFHASMVKTALEHDLNVFCEKPLCLTSAESEDLARLAADRGLVTQVGYHNRFVGAFEEVKHLLDAQAIGKVTHVLAEAYGPVVLKPKGSTWRSQRSEGGGCLYDYAAHPINLVNWYLGAPTAVGGTVLGSVFSADTEDEVFGTLYFRDGVTGQVSVNWSDESYRKMTTRITVWGTLGRITADRQECQVYLRDQANPPEGYRHGWNVRYTTELTDQVWFYLRGEEYSAQLDAFVQRVAKRDIEGINDFSSAAVTDRVLELMVADAAGGVSTTDDWPAALAASAARRPDETLTRRAAGLVRDAAKQAGQAGRRLTGKLRSR